MPEFLDQFVLQVRAKRDRLRSYLSIGWSSPLDKDLKDLLHSNWHSFPRNSSAPFKIFAVDGSRALRHYVVGSILYVVRALGLSDKERIRDLEVDSFLSRSGSKNIGRFVNRKMEWLEHRVATQAAQKLEGKGYLLIDGTLYGRIMAVPRDSAAEGQKSFMLQYFEDYIKLFETCRERGVVPIGVSKDSRATFLRDYLLSILLEKHLADLTATDSEKVLLRSIFGDLIAGKRRSLSILQGMEGKHPDMVKIKRIMWEARSPRKYHQLLSSFVEDTGYSTPLELGAYGRGAGLIKQYLESPTDYVQINFAEAMDEAQDREEFLERARKILSRIPELPTIVSFHLLLNGRDSPVRVDVPSWALGLRNTMADKIGSSPVEIGKDKIGDIISALLQGYGGLRNYNILLVEADREVKLRRETVDRLYHAILEKELGLPLPLVYVRGYRRVRYP